MLLHATEPAIAQNLKRQADAGAEDATIRDVDRWDDSVEGCQL